MRIFGFNFFGERRFFSRALAIFWLCATAVHAQTQAPITLYHRFTVGIEADWERVRLPLRGEEWRVGSPQGPAATPEQWRRVLESLNAVVIGCRCAGSTAEAVHYPNYLELAHAQIDGAPAAQADPDQRWRSTSGETLLTFASGVTLATSVSDADQSRLAKVMDADVLPIEPGYLGLMAPQSLLAAISSAGSESLSFDIRVRPGPLTSAKIEPSSGIAILSTQRMRVDQPMRQVRATGPSI